MCTWLNDGGHFEIRDYQFRNSVNKIGELFRLLLSRKEQCIQGIDGSYFSGLKGVSTGSGSSYKLNHVPVTKRNDKHARPRQSTR